MYLWKIVWLRNNFFLLIQFSPFHFPCIAIFHFWLLPYPTLYHFSCCLTLSHSFHLVRQACQLIIFHVIDTIIIARQQLELIMLPHKCMFSLCLFMLSGFTRALNCTSNSEDSAYEPFPKNVVPPQFHTRMEVTLSHRNETYFVLEIFDSEEERGTFTLFANGYEWESYWDKSENEIDYVYRDECSSYNW